MIKLFRQIRQELLRENQPAAPARRFSKYLIYAVGEIALVVIGILIALQINNWNEARKSNLDLTNKLQLIQVELNNDITFYENLVNSNESTLDFLLALSEKKYQSIDLTTTAVKISRNLDPRNFGTAYNAIKESGQLNQIMNTDLRDQIVNYYEDICVNFNDFSVWHRKFVAENIDNYILEYLSMDSDAKVKPTLILEEMENHKLPNIVNFQAVILKRFISTSTLNMTHANDLISQISREINR